MKSALIINCLLYSESEPVQHHVDYQGAISGTGLSLSVAGAGATLHRVQRINAGPFC